MSMEQNEPLLQPDEVSALISSLAPEDELLSVLESLPLLKRPEHVSQISIEKLSSEGLEYFSPFIKVHESLSEKIIDEWLDSIAPGHCSVETPVISRAKLRDLIEKEDDFVFMACESSGHGRYLIDMETHLLIAFIDALLGGKCETLREKPCVISKVELKLAQHIADMLTGFIDNVWLDATSRELHSKAYRIDPNVQFLSVAPASEVFISVSMHVKLADVDGMIEVYYPQSYIDPLIKLLRQVGDSEDSERDPVWDALLQQQIAACQTDVALKVGHLKLSIGDFLNIKGGDFLPLQVGENEVMEMFVSGKCKYLASAGQKDGMLAAEIVRIL
ncbi:MAG: FliM/FliN family flagellar motor switch protein [Mariprofundaceae bacterium]